MSLDDIFGAFPGRPNHPDMTRLTDIVLQHDGKTEDPDFDMGAFIGDVVDPESLTHLAVQRAARLKAIAGITEPQAVHALSSMFLDAFLMGAAFEKRRAEGTD